MEVLTNTLYVMKASPNSSAIVALSGVNGPFQLPLLDELIGQPGNSVRNWFRPELVLPEHTDDAALNLYIRSRDNDGFHLRV